MSYHLLCVFLFHPLPPIRVGAAVERFPCYTVEKTSLGTLLSVPPVPLGAPDGWPGLMLRENIEGYDFSGRLLSPPSVTCQNVAPIEAGRWWPACIWQKSTWPRQGVGPCAALDEIGDTSI